jgi:hypothetical protein
MASEKRTSKAKNPSAIGRTCVLILGMHRSGTSALAGVLSNLGCALPTHQMAPSASNAKGFFESTIIRDFNDELLASAGSSWDDFTEFHKHWIQSAQAATFLDRALTILEGEFGGAELFVLKDPRICRLVPFWARALARFGCAVKPILPIRNPLDVGQSLLAKRGISEPVGHMIWLRHALDAEHATRGMSRLHTSFEQVMQEWELVVQRAQEDLQLVWPKSIASVEFEVARFLSGDLRHHDQAPGRAVASTLLPEWLRETYRILVRWSEGGESPDDHPTLDRIKAEFDVASNAFARLVRAERDVSREQRHRSEELKQAAKKLQSELDDATVSAKVLEEERSARMLERETWGKLLDEARAVHDAADRQIAELTASLQHQTAAFEEQNVRAGELEGELAVARANAGRELAALEELLQEQRRRNTLMDAELHVLKEARETLEFELAEARSELAASQARRKEAARIIARRDAEIQARFQELAVLERKIIRSSLSWKAQRLLQRLRTSFGEKAYP